ncbi:N-ethylammeline chlorohydrolase [Streptococcus pneumoniae]|nr:N-ethylammeline chlorohydrolase [Streptococcus pneumoniae]VPW14475.1 N-ethylammeline chlorohydrolase [Streptococcus pneumoniae]VQE25697.1 N-ethylammeline chlorohydrolase [Streptococcus pneumoniae]VSD33894.1 N-ethylammeline chlorohydrolase [Streptococcus pneumoniae]
MKKLDTMRFIVGRFTSFSTEIELLLKIFLYSMKIKVQTRKLAAGCSKHCFEVVDRTDEVSNHTYGKATLTWFEEIFEEY